jgi:hypothetical protein
MYTNADTNLQHTHAWKEGSTNRQTRVTMAQLPGRTVLGQEDSTPLVHASEERKSQGGRMST